MNNKRNFLKNTIFAGLGFGIISKINTNTLFASHNISNYSNYDIAEEIKAKAPFNLPILNYSYNALEPNIDALTMEIHHTKHHKA